MLEQVASALAHNQEKSFNSGLQMSGWISPYIRDQLLTLEEMLIKEKEPQQVERALDYCMEQIASSPGLGPFRKHPGSGHHKQGKHRGRKWYA